MSKKNTNTTRSSVPNKKKTPSIYRTFEGFALDLTKYVDNIPGKPMLQGYVRRLSDEVVDCLAAVRYAYSTQDYKLRHEYLSDMEIHLDLIKSIIGLLFEYASSTNSKFMSPKTHARFLLSLENIERQRSNWDNSTLRYVAGAIKPMTPSLHCPQELKDLDLSLPENAHFIPIGDDRFVNNSESCGEEFNK